MASSPEAPSPDSPHETALVAAWERQKRHAAELKRQSAAFRIERLKALRAALVAQRDAVKEALWEDFRKAPESVDKTEILPVVFEISHARRNLRRWMKPRRVRTPLFLFGTSAHVRYEPKGTALIMAPWNYPVNLTVGPLVAAVAAGCPAIIKPSEFTPATGAVVRDLVARALPPEEALVVEGDVEIARTLLGLPFDHIYFTGSPPVGTVVMRAAAEHLASVTLELGGKSPCIVDRTADVRHAARVIAFSKFANCGQTCIAPDHVYVHDAVYDRFVDALRSRIHAYFGPDATDRKASAGFGRLIHDRAADRMQSLIAEAVAGGATVHVGEPEAAEGRFMDAVVLGDIPPGARVMDEEIFGPVLPLIRFRALDEVAADINRRTQPLALYVFSTRSRTVEEMVHATSAGATVVNDALIHFLNLDLPFGGIGASGVGKGKGEAGFRAFSNERAIMRQHLRPGLLTLLYPPYSGFTRRLLDWLLRLY